MASRKKFITNYTIEQMEEILNSKADYRVAMRLMTCILVAKGFSVSDLEKIFYYKSAARYFYWARRFNEEGLNGLTDKEGRGRKSKLTEANYEELKNILVYKSPDEFGFNSHVWNGEIITDLIKQKYGISYQKANIYIMLKKKLKLVNLKSFGIQEARGVGIKGL